jgi:hypothetical protein
MKKRIKIGNTSYKIAFVEKHPMPRSAASINYDLNEIIVATHNNQTGKPFSDKYVFDSYVHELTHAILREMGHQQYRDEGFVRPFASHLARALFKKE